MVNGTCKANLTSVAPKNPLHRSEEEDADYAQRVSALSHQQQDLLRQKEMEIMKLHDQVTWGLFSPLSSRPCILKWQDCMQLFIYIFV